MFGIFSKKTNQLDCDPEPMTFDTYEDAHNLLHNFKVYSVEDFEIREVEELFQFEDCDGWNGETEVYATEAEAVDAALHQWNHLTPREQKDRLNTKNGAVFAVTEIDKDGGWIADVWEIHDYLEEIEEEEVE